MTKKRLMQIVLIGIKQLRDPYYQGFAAQVSFYFILALVPVGIVLSQLLGLFSVSLTTLNFWIDQYLTGDVAKILKGLVVYSSTGTMNVVLIVVALWAASRAEFSLMRITNYTFTSGQSTGNGYFRERLRALKTMLITLFTIAFSLIVLVYGEIIIKLAFTLLSDKLHLEYHVDSFWLLLRWPVAMALYFFMVSYNYYVLPTEKLSFRQILPGSVFASVGMLLVTFFYSIYVEKMANYDIIYGSLASIVALMFWFYFLAWTLGLGILCNKAWKDTKNV